MHEVKCENCGRWNEGTLEYCQFCGSRLNDKHLKDKEEREKQELRGMPFIKVNKDAPFFKRGFQYVILFIQLAFATFISILASIASSTVH